MYFQNVRGLRTKLNTLINSLLTSAVSYDVIIFVETWLTSAISSNELGLRNYAIYRCDRSQSTSTCTRGGGVLIAVKDSMPSCSVTVGFSEVEQLFVRAQLHKDKHVVLGAVYIPPASLPSLYASHADTVSEVFLNYSDDIFCLFGDFNLPHAVWLNNSVQGCFRGSGVSSNESTAIDLLLGCVGYCNLTQVNTVFNQFQVMLDLIFVSCPNVMVDRVIDALIVPDAYHPPLHIVLKGLAPAHVRGGENSEYRDFKRCDFSSVCEFLNQIDWDKETGDIEPNVALERLYGHINQAIDAFVPMRSVIRSTIPLWFSPSLRSLIRQKKGHILLLSGLAHTAIILIFQIFVRNVS